MNLVSWNCRGMGSSLKTNAVRDLLKSEHPDILLLQETKINDQDFKNFLKINKIYEGTTISASGASGGIGTIWDKRNWKLLSQKHSSWWLRSDVQNVTKTEEYTIYNIYAPHQLHDKAACWNSIKEDLLEMQGRSIFLGGDLNLIRNSEEKLGGNFLADSSRDSLEEIILNHNLVDFQPQNGRFTWSNKRTGRHNIKERLDRILVQERIVTRFACVKSFIIQGYYSDHKPVTLKLDKGSNFGPLPFRYNRMWEEQEDFRLMVKDQWLTEVRGSPHYVWESKIKILRSAIKQWAKSKAVAENKIKTDLQTKLIQWNQERELRQDTEEELIKERDLQKELYKLNRKEEEEQRQKSRCLWLKAGDKNTSFFHNSVKLRRSANNIEKITVEGSEVRGQNQIMEAAASHFQNLLTEEHHEKRGWEILDSMENKTTAEQNIELDREITEAEIELTIRSMASDKAPGPDGFTIDFYKSHWDIIKKDYIRVVRNFFQKGKMGSGIKSSFLALIPKEPNPLTFNRFRPISLCNVSYKIITKILANRLKPILPSLISDNQGGFVPQRQIADNVILIQEAIHSSINRKEKGMIMKMDMANAFDRVNHSFLQAVLQKLGLSNLFISRVQECISGNWTAPLINGRPSKAFKSTRGLRQGCPLSPFLYILMAEAFSSKLESMRRRKEIMGIEIIRGSKGINHSLFADDTLLIGGASCIMARRFKNALDLFLQASGGKLSNNKCMIYTWNVPNHLIQRISRIMEIPAQLNWSHFMYLGLPLAKTKIKSESWVKIVEKFRSKLQNWGMHWLNLAGRTTLVKSVLASLPIYQFAITLAPASIHKHMELIMRSFLWQGGKQNSKKFSLVKWETVILPIEKGGLGIRVPRLANLAMGFKLIWRILNEKDSWWVAVLKKKYLNGPSSNILTESAPERQGTPTWNLIKKALPLCKSFFSKAPGNGRDVNIWNDSILGSQVRISNPHFYPLRRWMVEANLNSLFDISVWEEDRWDGWIPLNLPNDLAQLWVDLKCSLSCSAPVNRVKEDKFVWNPNGGNYSVREGYKALQDISSVNNWPLLKAVWSTECLPKIKFFIWTLMHGKILTAENLRKRGIQGPSICCMCRSAEETIPHLFIECPIAKACWNLLSEPISSEVLPPKIQTLHKRWDKRLYQPKGNTIMRRLWSSIPSNLCWQIWKARNKCIFNNEKPKISGIVANSLAFIAESLEAKGVLQSDLEVEEERHKVWLGNFNLKPNTRILLKNKTGTQKWKLRGTEEEVHNWIRSQNKNVLYFDGASKKNPGQAGAGGIIKDPHGNLMVSFEWGLGQMSNNKAEAYGLLLGSHIAKNLGLRNLLILGDSAIIIKAMISGKDYKQRVLNNIKDRTMENIKELGDVTFRHVLRSNNKEADHRANLAVRRSTGQVCENDQTYAKDIP